MSDIFFAQIGVYLRHYIFAITVWDINKCKMVIVFNDIMRNNNVILCVKERTSQSSTEPLLVARVHL